MYREVMRGEAMRGEVMRGEVMRGEVMRGEVMRGEALCYTGLYGDQGRNSLYIRGSNERGSTVLHRALR